MKNTVFVHTNARQMVDAIVGRHSLKRNSANPDAFDVKITSQEDFPFFRELQGRKFLRGGDWRVWDNADPQSFTPARFMSPELMGYAGRLDYEDWIELKAELADSIGHLESRWNDFDRMAPDTRLIHNTNRRTRPGRPGCQSTSPTVRPRSCGRWA